MPRAASKNYNLLVLNPGLSKEWHPVKNGNLKASDITPGSDKKVWWICEEGHEWQSIVGNRHRLGVGCPYCSGNLACKDNCLAVKNTKLAKDWHPTKNGDLKPEDVLPNYNKKVWWICEKGHEWKATCNNRSQGNNCPFCFGNKVSKNSSLAIINPVLILEWHLTKNLPFTPKDFTANSGKKAFWVCQKGHEWEAVIASRNKGSKCPYCCNQKIGIDNNLAVVNPKLAKEWHPTMNKGLKPTGVSPGSDKKYWWICQKGHEWKARIDNRRLGKGCPYCAGQAVCHDNCLATLNPELTKEWHPTKNKSLTPYDVVAKSIKKVWWVCQKGHEWKADIANRNKGIGCPHCYFQSSKIELKLYSELKILIKNIEHRKKLHGIECDIYIPKSKIAIEYDGEYWHKDSFEKDKIKTEALNRKGVTLIRIREKGLKKVKSHDLLYDPKSSAFNLVLNILRLLLKISSLDNEEIDKIKLYLKGKDFVNENEYEMLIKRLPHALPGKSLMDLNLQLTKDWHPIKNGEMTPYDVTLKSGVKVWWLCQKRHSYEMAVCERTRGRGCPYCAGRRVNKDNCLASVGEHENGPKTNQGGAVENVAMSRDLLEENTVSP